MTTNTKSSACVITAVVIAAAALLQACAGSPPPAPTSSTSSASPHSDQSAAAAGNASTNVNLVLQKQEAAFAKCKAGGTFFKRMSKVTAEDTDSVPKGECLGDGYKMEFKQENCSAAGLEKFYASNEVNRTQIAKMLSAADVATFALDQCFVCNGTETKDARPLCSYLASTGKEEVYKGMVLVFVMGAPGAKTVQLKTKYLTYDVTATR